MDIANELTKELAPLNNAYRKAVKDGLPGNEVLKILWDAGEVICAKKIDHVHNIAWQIYGKSNSKRRSYLTRDYIAYCWRVRRYFSSREDIDREFPRLKSHKAFKEALPLLTNPKYKLSKGEKAMIYNLLNNPTLKATDIFDHLAKIKQKKVPLSNPRTQRLHELAAIRTVFDAAFNFSSNKGLELDQQEMNYISALWLALVAEGRSYPMLQSVEVAKLGFPWREVIEISFDFLHNRNVEDRNRFRRVIKPEELLRASALLSDNYKKSKS